MDNLELVVLKQQRLIKAYKRCLVNHQKRQYRMWKRHHVNGAKDEFQQYLREHFCDCWECKEGRNELGIPSHLNLINN
jgi:hypothetical protein